MDHISAIERYHDYRRAIHELMASIVTGIYDVKLLADEVQLASAMQWLHQNYPFVELIFTLDADGVQNSENISCNGKNLKRSKSGLGVDRRHRPYYRAAIKSDSVIVTEPYLSTSSHNLCISSAVRVTDESGKICGVIVIDIDLGLAISFLMGDSRRARFQPLFISVYSLIVIGLFIVVALLLISAYREILSLFETDSDHALKLKPFGIIIFLTLALAIFDLGKTTLEEEVLMHKDIFRHSSTRRTITRFIAAILIAVSIESLLLMFKSVLGFPEHLKDAVIMMIAAVGLLTGLGLYVFLGAKAEAVLKQANAANHVARVHVPLKETET